MHEGTHKRTLANINLKRCKICGITCDDGNLLAHLKEYHEHYQCDICNGLYRTKNHLKLHMITHINAREFKCSVCPKRFNFFSQVKRHERSHSATLVWYCEVCGQGFKTKPNLNHHMRSHNGEFDELEKKSQKFWLTSARLFTGEKPFQCDRCDRSYSVRIIAIWFHPAECQKIFRFDRFSQSRVFTYIFEYTIKSDRISVHGQNVHKVFTIWQQWKCTQDSIQMR